MHFCLLIRGFVPSPAPAPSLSMCTNLFCILPQDTTIERVERAIYHFHALLDMGPAMCISAIALSQWWKIQFNTTA